MLYNHLENPSLPSVEEMKRNPLHSNYLDLISRLDDYAIEYDKLSNKVESLGKEIVKTDKNANKLVQKASQEGDPNFSIATQINILIGKVAELKNDVDECNEKMKDIKMKFQHTQQILSKALSNNNPLPLAEEYVAESSKQTAGPILVNEEDLVKHAFTEPEISNKEKALNLYSELRRRMPLDDSIVKLAVEQATESDVKDIETFAALYLRVNNEIERQNENMRKLQEASKSYIQKFEESVLKQYPDVDDYAQKLLEKEYNLCENMLSLFDVQYNTTRLPGVLNSTTTLAEELQFQLYSKPAFAIIQNINSKAVSNAVKYSIEALESEEFTQCINQMIKCFPEKYGDNIEEERNNLLRVANENPIFGKGVVAPDNYKLWFVMNAYFRVTGEKSSIDMSRVVFSDDKVAVEYQARVTHHKDKGIPFNLATDVSCHETMENMDDERFEEVVDNVEGINSKVLKTARAVGSLTCTVINKPIKGAKDLKDAIRLGFDEQKASIWGDNVEKAKQYQEDNSSSMGFKFKEASSKVGDSMKNAIHDKWEEFKEDRAEDKALNREIKRAKKQAKADMALKMEEVKAQQQILDAQAKATQRSGPQNVSYSNSYNGYNAYGGGYNNGRYQRPMGQTPPALIVLPIYIIVALLIWLFGGNVRGVCAGICTALTGVTLFTYRTQGIKSFLYAVAGHIILILAFMLF